MSGRRWYHRGDKSVFGVKISFGEGLLIGVGDRFVDEGKAV